MKHIEYKHLGPNRRANSLVTFNRPAVSVQLLVSYGSFAIPNRLTAYFRIRREGKQGTREVS